MNRVARTRKVLADGTCAVLLPATLFAAPVIGTTYFVQDHLGSVVVVSDAYGNAQARTAYRPYDKPTTVDSGSADGDARFTGKAMDSAIRLYYFDARYRDPQFG